MHKLSFSNESVGLLHRMDDFNFDLLPNLIGYNLRKAQTAVFRDFSLSLRDCNITPGQFGVLVLVQANIGLNQTTLGKALGIDRSTVVAVIDKLEARGLVERTPALTDRRSYALQLSPQGKNLLCHARNMVAKHEKRISKGLSKPDQVLLISLLQKLQDDL